MTRRSPTSVVETGDLSSGAENVLALATESASMLRGIEDIFSQTVAGAESVMGTVPESELFNLHKRQHSHKSDKESETTLNSRPATPQNEMDVDIC